jgi:hypothetical protein
MTTLQSERQEIFILLSFRSRRIFYAPKLADMAWTHTSSYSVGTGGIFLGDKTVKA